MRTGDLLRAAADALIAMTLAPRCAACRRLLGHPAAGPVCAACWSSVRVLAPPYCRTCGDPLPSWRLVSVSMEQCARCRRQDLVITCGRSAGEYEGALREIIHAFKYEGRRSLASRLGRLMCDAGSEILRDAHCAVPVPLHPWRRMQRGFNQAADLAAATQLPVVHALWRRRATVPQTGLSAAARHRNVRDAFCPSPLLSRRRRESSLRDRVVLLIDDVRTTGATLEACAQVLKEAGAFEVRALTAARAAPASATPHGRRR